MMFNIKKHKEFLSYCGTEEYCLNNTYINARNSCIVALLVDTGVIISELCYNKIRDAREISLALYPSFIKISIFSFNCGKVFTSHS